MSAPGATPVQPTRKRPKWGLTALVGGLVALLLVVSRSALYDLLLRLDGVAVVAEHAELQIASTAVGGVAHPEIVLRNLTAKPIHVVGAASSCNCTGPVGSFPIVLPPYESRSIPCTLQVSNRAQAGDRLAKLRFFVDVESQDVSVNFRLAGKTPDGK